jgi:uncharacterized protein (DUF952 family)
MIYHVTDKANWEQALAAGFYEAPSLHSEGFIHASSIHQVAGVLDRYYKNKTDLVLLHIDESQLVSQVKYELAPKVNEIFPHIFGAVNIDAIINVELI